MVIVRSCDKVSGGTDNCLAHSRIRRENNCFLIWTPHFDKGFARGCQKRPLVGIGVSRIYIWPIAHAVRLSLVFPVVALVIAVVLAAAIGAKPSNFKPPEQNILSSEESIFV